MSRFSRIFIAWIAMLLASYLPFIIWRAFLHHSEIPAWISMVQLLGLGAAGNGLPKSQHTFARRRANAAYNGCGAERCGRAKLNRETIGARN